MLKAILLIPTIFTSILACPPGPNPSPQPSSRCNVPQNITASAPPVEDLSPNFAKRDDYFKMDCHGSEVCRWPWSDACEKAFDLIREDVVYVSGEERHLTGVCATKPKWPMHKNGCGIFVSKPLHVLNRWGGGTQREGKCQMNGATLKDHVRRLRDFGCKRCGRSTDQFTGCMAKIDYVAHCD